MNVTYIGGPTALLELAGLRLLTDPTFDPAGEEYATPIYTLRKNSGPAIDADSIGHIDAVLLSHDHHFDNLDRAGRALLRKIDTVLTTEVGAGRLDGSAIGLAPWQSVDLPAPDGRTLRITATPARHGPADGDRGPVIGFVLELADSAEPVVYLSGDTVWYDGVAEVGRRFALQVALLFMGSARVPEVGPAHLTMTAQEGVEIARAFAGATIIPLHYEGWEHFAESRRQIEEAFALAGLEGRVQWMEPGVATDVVIDGRSDRPNQPTGE
jgi:L-ascorbate metabolism protein UlaG (beta-lactamase superfamily)